MAERIRSVAIIVLSILVHAIFQLSCKGPCDPSRNQSNQPNKQNPSQPTNLSFYIIFKPDYILTLIIIFLSFIHKHELTIIKLSNFFTLGFAAFQN